MYTTKTVWDNCFNVRTFERGSLLHKQGLADVRVIEEEEENYYIISGTVEGSRGNRYEVSLNYDADEEDFMECYCECEAFISYPGFCKHCVALALTAMGEFTAASMGLNPAGKIRKRMPKTSHLIEDLIRTYAHRQRVEEETASGEIEIIPELERVESFYAPVGWKLTFKIGAARKYVLKNCDEFADAVRNERSISYGKQLAFVPTKSMFTPKAWEYAQFITNAVSNYSYTRVTKELSLSETELVRFLKISLGDTIAYTSSRRRFREMTISAQNPPLKMKLQEKEEGLFGLEMPSFSVLRSPEDVFVLLENKAYLCSDDFCREMEPILRLEEYGEQEFEIAEADMRAFCKTVVPRLESAKCLNKGKLDLQKYLPESVKICFYLDEEDGRVTVKPEGHYGETVCNLLQPVTVSDEFRDLVGERSALERARAYFPEEDTKEQKLYFNSGDEERMYHLLDTGLKQLGDAGEVYLSEKMRQKKLIRAPKAQVGVSMQSGLLELDIKSEEFAPEDLQGILEQYRKRKKFFRLKNGDFLNLEDNGLEAVAELLDGLSLRKGELESDTIQVPKFQACFIDQVLGQGKGSLRVERSKDYKAIIRDMKNVEDSDFTVPEGLEEILRPYQKNGFRWLCTLGELGFGGILADDMGLGKTLQAIACLKYRKESGHGASLIVCPASLVYNWQKELEKFAPDLSVKLVIGPAAVREERILEEEPYDVWVTSYDMLKRDVALYTDKTFDVQILDEAQNIKNHGTQAAKSVKQIQAAVHFALTGTPIENRLSEMWSIFDYLMPGILGSYETFRKKYEVPIIQNQNSDAAERLKKMITPFLLRRVKKDVLKDLPDKLEQPVYAKMGDEQRKLYVAAAQRMKESLQNKSQDEIRSGKLQILAELTRLRQLCCDPKLLYDNVTEESCKVETCLELVEEAVDGNHKVLIFSQFTSIFPILQKKLSEKNISYYTLTGETSKEKRMQLVEAFQQDDTPVFLISLKAGGTGLNLTAASVVIHFDPWWNQAAQNQATDRAHRIGQEEQVTVYKLVARDTIEEKIIDLQERKQKLADQFLEGEGISASSLSKEELLEILQ